MRHSIPRTTLLTVGDTAKRLEVSTSRVRQLELEGQLVAFRDSAGNRLFDPEVVEAFRRRRASRAAGAL